MGIVIFKEKNLTEGVYMPQSASYSVWVTEAKIRQQGAIAVAWQR